MFMFEDSLTKVMQAIEQKVKKKVPFETGITNNKRFITG